MKIISSIVLMLSSLLLFAPTPQPYPILQPGCNAANYPPEEKDWYFSVDPAEKPWTYSFSMSEIGEPYLGTAIFDSLPARFAKIPGVVRVLQEDREMYLIKSQGLSPKKLKTALWQKFKAAAAQACGRG